MRLFYVFGEEKGRKKGRGKIYTVDVYRRERETKEREFLESIPLCAFIRLTREKIYREKSTFFSTFYIFEKWIEKDFLIMFEVSWMLFILWLRSKELQKNFWYWNVKLILIIRCLMLNRKFDNFFSVHLQKIILTNFRQNALLRKHA